MGRGETNYLVDAGGDRAQGVAMVCNAGVGDWPGWNAARCSLYPKPLGRDGAGNVRRFCCLRVVGRRAAGEEHSSAHNDETTRRWVRMWCTAEAAAPDCAQRALCRSTARLLRGGYVKRAGCGNAVKIAATATKPPTCTVM